MTIASYIFHKKETQVVNTYFQNLIFLKNVDYATEIQSKAAYRIFLLFVLILNDNQVIDNNRFRQNRKIMYFLETKKNYMIHAIKLVSKKSWQCKVLFFYLVQLLIPPHTNNQFKSPSTLFRLRLIFFVESLRMQVTCLLKQLSQKSVQ